MNNRLNVKRDVLGIINASCFDTIESEFRTWLATKARQQAYWCFHTTGRHDQFAGLQLGIEEQMIAELQTKLSHS